MRLYEQFAAGFRGMTADNCFRVGDHPGVDRFGQYYGVTQGLCWPAAIFRETDFPGIGSERPLSTVRL